MKKLRNFLLIAGAAVLVFGLSARVVPGINITDFAFGFCCGLAGTLILAGLVLLASPLYCRKKKE
jgi:hypothetical protein